MEIRALDYGFTSDVSVAAFVEKWVINGFGRAATDFKMQLPTHVFQYVEVYGRLKIMEMVADKNDKRIRRLTLNSVTRYDKNGPLGERVIAVRRCNLYDNPAIRKMANERHLQRWADGKTLYDIEELFSFPKAFRNIFGKKNDPGKLVCSSEVEDELNKDGYSFTDFPLIVPAGQNQGLIAPDHIMKAKYVTNKNGNRFEMMPVTLS